MTEILFQRFRGKFPAIGGQERITLYGAYERIYLNLMAREFLETPYFDSHEKIKDLASKTFDVNFISKFLNDGGQRRLAIIFVPIILPKSQGGTEELMRYNDNYSEHSIDIDLPTNHPMITISTGNRGRTDLLDRQRDIYYNFVEGIYGLFLENARSQKS